MKLGTIRAKVIAIVLICLALGLGSTLVLLRMSFNRNAQVLAKQSVNQAQTLFGISEARDISKMGGITDTLDVNPQIGDALAAKDRSRLQTLTTPLFEKLKTEGITMVSFHTPEPDMRVFLRLHNPSKFGDKMNRSLDQQVTTTHTVVVGNEIGRSGFALRTMAPVKTSKGDLVGYVELGEELGGFIEAMKAQTGDNYGLVLNKKYMNRQFWAESSTALNRRDDWDDSPNTVVLTRTTDSDSIFKFDGDISTLPVEGKVLEQVKQGKSVFVRGAFPIQDAAGNNVGAIFVVHDISTFYLEMRRSEQIFVILIFSAVLVGTIIFLWILDRLIFKRLKGIIAVATRVVGGDFHKEIKVSSNDEVGQFESLFEQFRGVFVSLLEHVPELQEK